MINLQNKKVTVMGLGLHGGGVTVAKWLVKQGARVLITDLKTKQELHKSIQKLADLDVKFVLGKHKHQDFERADLVVKNPGVPKESKFLKIAKKNKIPIETDVSLFFKLCPVPIIGITGTKGKSTTTALLNGIFEKAGRHPVMAGNIRISPLSVLDKIKNNTPVILELSSWQLEDMNHLRKSPHVAVITNILPDHLNRHKSMQDYINAKKIIFKYQSAGDFLLLNNSNGITRQFVKESKAQPWWFSQKAFQKTNGCFVRRGWIIYRQNGKESMISPIKDVKIPGQHNLENALACIAVAKIFNISNHAVRDTLKQFKGIPGRLELIRRWKGIKFFNDTTATTPEAVIAALNSLDKKVTLIAGGADKGLKYGKLVRQIKDKVEFLVLFKGQASDKMINHLKQISFTKWQSVEDMPQAVKLALRNRIKSKIILLSPGAASFGIFTNEFDRGDQFVNLVNKIK